jgi:hypothetical protein
MPGGGADGGSRYWVSFSEFDFFANAAKQSIFVPVSRKMDCFASLAMTF